MTSESGTRHRLLFVCVENSNRSQMAEAFARLHGGDLFEAFSAGSKPSGVVNPAAIAAMHERGYDLTRHQSKSLDDIPAGPYSAVVTMGCGDACPWIAAAMRDDWDLPDPKSLGPDGVRAVRDDIERRVLALLASLRAAAGAAAGAAASASAGPSSSSSSAPDREVRGR